MPVALAVNFGTVEVSTGYDASATSITLSTGEGATLPTPTTKRQFNLLWWDGTNYTPLTDPNRELVRCTNRAGDVLTVVRAQEGTAATTKNTGSATYQMRLVQSKRSRDEIAAVIGEVYSVKDPAFGAAGAYRQASESLVRKFGNEASDIIADALERAEREGVRYFNEQNDDI